MASFAALTAILTLAATILVPGMIDLQVVLHTDLIRDL